MTVVKICGITNLEDALLSVRFGADMLGFNFYERSPRFIAPEIAAGIIRELPDSINKVGIFVNDTVDNIIKIADKAALNFVQLHGDENAGFVRSLAGLNIIKAFRVDSNFSSDQIIGFDGSAKFFFERSALHNCADSMK